MITIFMRHGDAEERGHGVPGEDETRELTKRGKRETKLVAIALDRLKVRPGTILTSPLTRARQTAEIITKQIKRAPRPVEFQPLAPGHDWKTIRGEIIKTMKPQQDDVILLSGHQPDMGSYLLDALLARSNGKYPEISFPKSGCVVLLWDDPKMTSNPRIVLALDPGMAKKVTKSK